VDDVLTRRTRIPLLVAVLVLVLALATVSLAGCGETAAEKALENAAEQNGQDVDIDIDAGKGSVSGESGDVTWQSGENVSIPEGFPTDLIPDGAKVMSAITSTEAGSPAQIVVFEISTDDKDMYDYYLDALPKAGYEITNKVRMEGGDQGNAIAVQGQASNGTVLVSGGGKTGEKYSYMITVRQ